MFGLPKWQVWQGTVPFAMSCKGQICNTPEIFLLKGPGIVLGLKGTPLAVSLLPTDKEVSETSMIFQNGLVFFLRMQVIPLLGFTSDEPVCHTLEETLQWL